MKFILNKDTLEIENIEVVKSGSLNYYEAEVEYDESWKDLVIEAIMVKKSEEAGTSIGVISNKIFLDQNLRGTYCIGFVGYKIEEEKKVYQVSTNLKSVYFEKGAGEVEIENAEVPTPTEWEIYIAQIQEMLKDISVSGGAIHDVLVDGKSVVADKVANIDLSKKADKSVENSVKDLDNVLRDILLAIQSGISASMIIEEIEQLIVSYFENKTVEEVEG